MPDGFTFGIYPFSVVGMASGLASGAPDDFQRLPGIIDELRGGRKLLLRNYIPFSGEDSIPTALKLTEMVAGTGAPWDVILTFRFDGDDLSSWLGLIHQIVARFGKSLDTLQITGEPNLRGMPDAGDGSRPHIRRALQEGVLAAKSAARAVVRTWQSGLTQSRLSKPPAAPTTISGRPFDRSATNSSRRSTTSAWTSIPTSSARRSRPSICRRQSNPFCGDFEHTIWPPAESRHQSPFESVKMVGQPAQTAPITVRPRRWSRSFAPSTGCGRS